MKIVLANEGPRIEASAIGMRPLGGVETAVALLAREFTARGHALHLHFEGEATPPGPDVVDQPPPSLKRETCIILSFMAFLTLMTGAVLHHFERKRPRRRVISIQHAFVYSRSAARRVPRARRSGSRAVVAIGSRRRRGGR